MSRTAIALVALGIAIPAAAQNPVPGPELNAGDYCMYGGQLYSLGASICIGREVAIRCIRYSSVVNELRDINPNVEDQTRGRPVWFNFQAKLC
jgi:hypothetical protein